MRVDGRGAGPGARKEAAAPLRERAVPHLSGQQLRAWRGVLELQAVLMPKLEAELREETGLTINEFDVLYQLWRAPGGVRRVGDLAHDVLVTPGGVTRLADRLVDRGLVERRREDGRQAVELALTSAGGHRIRAAMDVRFRGVRRRFVDLLDAEEVELLAKIWARLRAHNAGED
ncbi:MarR family winged helix-turn-helix transcriptional regulator [Streptomyces yatensis]|uniref:MarR family winged helix-turn-helix transcriptional regulator n=1 Tax=Streptomyces yatensis TaxID=155177 RepID=A0ABN2J589_9ACTN